MSTIVCHLYLFQFRYFTSSQGPEDKNNPSLPYLVKVLYLPLTHFSPSSELFFRSYSGFVSHVLAIPLLPYRIPLTSLSELSGQLPLGHLHVLSSCVPDIISVTSTSSQINIVANLLAFTPPRYTTLPVSSLKAYLQLLSALLNVLPPHALEPPLPQDSRTLPASWADDSDSDSDRPANIIARSALPPLDSRTQKRLQILPSPPHINSLLKPAQQHPELLSDLVSMLLSLNLVWPSRKEKVLTTLLLYGGGGLVREIYREYVRTTPLGRDENLSSLMGIYPRCLLTTIIDRF